MPLGCNREKFLTQNVVDEIHSTGHTGGFRFKFKNFFRFSGEKVLHDAKNVRRCR